MDIKKLKTIISQGENEIIEFKENFNDKSIETLVAFANDQGGSVFLGITDNKKIIGVKTGQEGIQKMINEIKQKTEGKIIPSVKVIDYNKKEVIILTVIEYPSKPISFKGRYYKRFKNSNHLMNSDEIANEYLRTRNKSWDMFLTEEKYTISDLDFDKILNVINKINESRENKIESDPLSFLKKFALIQDEKITNAAWLLFGKDLKRSHITEIQIGLFETDTVIKKSVTIKNDLITEVKAVMDFIMIHITKEYIITGKPERDEKWQYPMSAIREFVINAIIHRDYRIGVHSQFKVFRNKISLWNIGQLPNNLSIEDIYTGNERSEPRNIKIAEIFKEMKLIEKYGSGVKRAVEETINYGLPKPQARELVGGFDIEVYGPNEKDTVKDTPRLGEKLGEKLGGKLGEKLGENQLKLLKLIKKNPVITTKEMSKRLNISTTAIDNNIAKLKQKNLLKRIGPDKGGYWETEINLQLL